ASIVGHEIRTERGGEKVVFEIRLGDWDAIDNLCVGGAVEGNSCNDDADCPNCLNPLDPDCAESQCGVSLRAYQVNIDSSGYTSGLQGALTPHLEPCLTSADCTVTMGGHCSITGDFCVTTEMCPLSDAPFFEVCAPGTSCEFRVRDRAGTFCAPGFIDKDRGGPNGFVFPDPLIAVDLTTKNYRFGAATAGDSVHDPDPFPPGGLYGGVLVLDVSANAKGTFTINMIPPGVGGSGMLDQNNQDIALLGLVPGRVTVEVGRCCFDLAGAGGCVDSVTRDECEGQPGPSTFVPGASCADGCCDCLTDVDCDDIDACTVDECGGATGCSCIRTPAFDEATQCCDPVTGTVEPLDDGSPCTLLGTCDPLTGEVTRPPASAGILCNDQEACTDNDRCDGAGTCAGDANIAGRACSSDDQCSGGSCFEGTCFCPAVVACCLSDGRCEPLPESNCEGRGGRRAAACLGDADGNGRDDACDQAVIPAVSGWGVAVMVCLLLAGGKHFFGRRITRGCRETFG
ncbi:MAG: hypothetical protein ACE5EX_10390, partial [Phycisphaerae bacterium]